MSYILRPYVHLSTLLFFLLPRFIERIRLFPYAVILQTTPIFAIAPLIILWLKNNTFAALVVCAWIVTFFPIVSNTTLGLNSLDGICSTYFNFSALSDFILSKWHE
ncbi:hypothetical protein [Nostoc edaphicum]|uniref:hypothetical protein n=1 Tax=Nostoc edaphicum TaxID=264686 RepID=UPI001EEB8449|nr:hypothetical protein [Nostoc edaphicum]